MQSPIICMLLQTLLTILTHQASIENCGQPTAGGNLIQALPSTSKIDTIQPSSSANDTIQPSTSPLTSVIDRIKPSTSVIDTGQPSMPEDNGSKSKVKDSRKRENTLNLTSTPYKSGLEAELVKPKQHKCRKLFQDEQKGHDKNTEDPKKKAAGKQTATKCTKEKDQEEWSFSNFEVSSPSADEDTTTSLFCNELFMHSRSGKGWIQCS
ncbi:hypothetical protein PR048_013867, partial [Dryococelus australis]